MKKFYSVYLYKDGSTHYFLTKTNAYDYLWNKFIKDHPKATPTQIAEAEEELIYNYISDYGDIEEDMFEDF